VDFFRGLINAIVYGRFPVHLFVLCISVILGIMLLQLFSKWIFRQIAKNDENTYGLLNQGFRGIPSLLGLLVGIYVAKEFLAIPPGPADFLEYAFHSIIIMTITLLIAHLGSGYLKYKLGKTSERLASTSILATTIDIAVYAIGILILLESFGIAISPLLTALGVGGLATALALQDTLANLFSGINTLLSKQIKIGDFVQLSTGESGHVVDMNWRNTTIKTATENMIVVPNKKIASSVIINYAQPFAACSISIPIGVSYGSNLRHVEAITVEVATHVLQENEGGADDFIPFVRYHDFGERSVEFDVILRVKTVMDQDFIRHEFIKAIYERYEEEHIVIPVKN
jgi:small-conductance mechanosensitive channel